VEGLPANNTNHPTHGYQTNLVTLLLYCCSTAAGLPRSTHVQNSLLKLYHVAIRQQMWQCHTPVDGCSSSTPRLPEAVLIQVVAHQVQQAGTTKPSQPLPTTP
jgi:hypothetical protein